MSNPRPNKPTAAAKFSARAKGGELALRVNCADLPVVEWKPLRLDAATLQALERAADPYKRFVGDGR
jgi:hypothetical protein